MTEKIIILDFGSQTTQLIARRIRELNTYCEIVPYNKFPKDDTTVKGVILSGSPFSVNDKDAFRADLSEIRNKLPLLGNATELNTLLIHPKEKLRKVIRANTAVLIWLQ